MSEARGTASPEGAQEDLFMKSFTDSTLPLFSEVSEIGPSKKGLSEGFKSEPINQHPDIDDGNDSSDTLTASECEDEDLASRNDLRYVLTHYFF